MLRWPRARPRRYTRDDRPRRTHTMLTTILQHLIKHRFFGHSGGPSSAPPSPQGSTRRAATLIAATFSVAVTLNGCCSSSDKKSLQEMVDRAIDRNFNACDSIPDPVAHATCITNAQNQQTALVTAYAAYLTACATGDTELIKEAIKNLKDLLKPKNGAVLGASGGVLNSEMVLGNDESVCISILLTSDGSRTPQDFVVVNGSKYLPEAAGSAALAVSGGNGSLIITTAVGDLAANSSTIYQVAPESTICFTASGMSMTGSVSGSMSFASAAGDFTSSYLPTDAKLTIAFAGSTYAMTLDKACKYNAMALDGNGHGTLTFRVNFASTGDAVLPARLPDGAWMVLPVQRNTTGTQIQASTGGASLSGWTVFPALPNPIADFDHNTVANDADLAMFLSAWASGNPSADVNHDGAVNALDNEVFMDRWNYWRQP